MKCQMCFNEKNKGCVVVLSDTANFGKYRANIANTDTISMLLSV